MAARKKSKGAVAIRGGTLTDLKNAAAALRGRYTEQAAEDRAAGEGAGDGLPSISTKDIGFSIADEAVGLDRADGQKGEELR